MQEKHILLARPNQLLVDKMLQFLARNNYAAQKLSSMEQLPHIDPESLHGIVISTSAISDVKENYASVYHVIKKHFPDVPVAFTVTADKAIMIKSIKQNLHLKGLDVELLDMTEAAKSKKSLNKFVLVIHEDDLPQARSDVAAHHFFG